LIRVAGIHTERNIVSAGVIRNPSAGLAEQRSDEAYPGVGGGWVLPVHPREALVAGSAQQTQKKKFHLIVLVMGQRDAVAVP
jgi:hypothetical protein